ncbi:hypothetical protein ABGV42_01200 [Paenibacillus pabuli]|uniref:hypothetical protein n=1 Tax=Paenibacillus pabuli TaxID=1472 RepID=UPI0032424B72
MNEGTNKKGLNLKFVGIGCLGLIVIAIIIAVVSFMVIWGQRNTAVGLDEQIKAQYVSNQSNYDNMWKKFKEIAQVTDMQADDFKEVYSGIIEGRYQDTQLLFKSVQESNPSLGTEVYTKLQNEISAGRTTFDRNQSKITDQIREYNTYIRRHVIMNFLFNFTQLDASKYIVTSERTQGAFDSGKDDEVNLR